MASLGLLEVAAQAEMLRLRRQARRMARTAALTAAAMLFAAFALALLHLAAWLWLLPGSGPLAAVLWLTATDMAAALALYVASRARPDSVAREALAIRRNALHALGTGPALGDILRLLCRNPMAHELGGMLVQALIRAIPRR